VSGTGREIHNPRTGQRIRFVHTAADTNASLLRLETVNPPTAVPEPMHVHPRQESRAEVIAGTLRFDIDGEERRLAPGDVLTIPPARPTTSSTTGTRTPSRSRSRLRAHEPTGRSSREPWLPEGERVRLGAGVEERDLQRPLADRVVLAYELVKAAVPEHAVPVLVDVPPV
jgi:mannose-6-phosphate isomerase-like protein (cupin superfamily)